MKELKKEKFQRKSYSFICIQTKDFSLVNHIYVLIAWWHIKNLSRKVWPWVAGFCWYFFSFFSSLSHDESEIKYVLSTHIYMIIFSLCLHSNRAMYNLFPQYNLLIFMLARIAKIPDFSWYQWLKISITCCYFLKIIRNISSIGSAFLVLE